MVGTANAQSTTASHNVSLNIQNWSYVDVQGGDVSYDVSTFSLETPYQADFNEVTGGNSSSGGFGEVSYDSNGEQTLRWGTNSNSALAVTATLGTELPEGIRLQIASPSNMNRMEITPHQYTMGNAGQLSQGYSASFLGSGDTPVVLGVSRGGGITPLVYRLHVQFFQSDEEGNFGETVTYTIGAGTGQGVPQ